MAKGDRPPTPERIVDTLNAYQRSSVLKAAIELDLFTAIGEGFATVPRLAERLKASTKGVRAMANYLVTLELLRREGDAYGLTPESSRYLDRRSPHYLGRTADFYTARAVVDGFAESAAAVRRGGSGSGGTDSMAPSHPIWISYARAMAPLFVGPADALAELILRAEPAPRRVLDVAAGHGLFGLAVARRFANATVTDLDWPEVVPVAASHAAEAGLVDRFRALEGSAFEVDVGDGWDVVILANFLHHFDRPTCDRLLRRLHRALRPKGLLAVVEFVPNEDRVSPPAVAQFGMTMLATTSGGDVYPFSDLAAMLTAAGFHTPELHPLAHTPQRAVLARA